MIAISFSSLCFLLAVVGSFAVHIPKKPCPGASAKVGDTVHVHYDGFIDKSSAAGQHDKLFDSSHKKGKPFKFTLGAGQVIKGWDEGIVGMCLGEKAELIVSPENGYGARGSGANIPPNATLRFALDIVGINDEVLKVDTPPNIFREMDTNGDNRISHDEMQAWFASKHPDRFTSIPPGLFERQDKNQDQFISWEEFQGPKGHSEHEEL